VQDDDHQDDDCCLTGGDFSQKALVVPKTELEWWISNNMSDIAGLLGGSRPTLGMGPEMMELRGNSEKEAALSYEMTRRITSKVVL